jgi:hypothetical protein
MAGFAAQGLDLTNQWTPREWEQLTGHGTGTGLTPEDSVVPLTDTTIQIGDLFELGPHRLLCGDATNADMAARVMGEDRPTIMIADQPYGLCYNPSWRVNAGGSGRHAVAPVLNDDRCDWAAAFALFPGAVAYVWHGALRAGEVAAALSRCGFEVRAQIIWAKSNFVLGRGNFHWQHEPAWYAVRKGHASNWSGSRSESTLWSIANMNPFSGGHDHDNPATGHSTQKPVALYERALLCNSAPGDCMFDPFAGSGTCFVAASKTARRCVGLELEPRYVQATIDRWEAYTGQSAQKVASRP